MVNTYRSTLRSIAKASHVHKAEPRLQTELHEHKFHIEILDTKKNLHTNKRSTGEILVLIN